MKKLIFWLKKNIKKDRGCKGFCLNCEYYEICMSDNSVMKKE